MKALMSLMAGLVLIASGTGWAGESGEKGRQAQKTSKSSEIRQLAGPGVAGMERDTPLYHVDMDKKDLDTLLAHPVEFFKRLGVGPQQGIARNGTMNVNIVQVNPGAQAIEWCCYVVGDTTTCHDH